jgi:hypothetical protein
MGRERYTKSNGDWSILADHEAYDSSSAEDFDWTEVRKEPRINFMNSQILCGEERMGVVACYGFVLNSFTQSINTDTIYFASVLAIDFELFFTCRKIRIIDRLHCRAERKENLLARVAIRGPSFRFPSTSARSAARTGCGRPPNPVPRASRRAAKWFPFISAGTTGTGCRGRQCPLFSSPPPGFLRSPHCLPHCSSSPKFVYWW